MLTSERYNDILSVNELLEILNIGRNTAYKLLKSGKVPSFRTGKVHRIPLAGLNEYIMDECRRNRLKSA